MIDWQQVLIVVYAITSVITMFGAAYYGYRAWGGWAGAGIFGMLLVANGVPLVTLLAGITLIVMARRDLRHKAKLEAYKRRSTDRVPGERVDVDAFD